MVVELHRTCWLPVNSCVQLPTLWLLQTIHSLVDIHPPLDVPNRRNECEHQNIHEFGSNKTNSYKPRCYSRESINRNKTCLRHPGHYGYVRYRLQLPVQLVGIFYFASVYARWRDVTLNSTWWIHVSWRNFTWTPYWEFLFMSAGKILEDKTGNLHRI